MTQLQTKINRPYINISIDILLRKTMDGGGRRDVQISDTPPATLAMIFARFDWPSGFCGRFGGPC